MKRIVRRPPEAIGALLPSVLRELGFDEMARVLRIAERWQEALGPELAPHCRPETLRGDVLEASVDSSVWCQQLQLRAILPQDHEQRERGEVHEAVPADRDRTNAERDRVELRMNQHRPREGARSTRALKSRHYTQRFGDDRSRRRLSRSRRSMSHNRRSRLITQGLRGDLDGEAELIFAPEGLACRITAPLDATPTPALALA